MTQQASAAKAGTLCRYFMNGACRNDNCPFSHNLHDLPNTVCTHWLRGTCAYGDKCRYDHVRPEWAPREEVTNPGYTAPTVPKPTTDDLDDLPPISQLRLGGAAAVRPTPSTSSAAAAAAAVTPAPAPPLPPLPPPPHAQRHHHHHANGETSGAVAGDEGGSTSSSAASALEALQAKERQSPPPVDLPLDPFGAATGEGDVGRLLPDDLGLSGFEGGMPSPQTAPSPRASPLPQGLLTAAHMLPDDAAHHRQQQWESSGGGRGLGSGEGSFAGGSSLPGSLGAAFPPHNPYGNGNGFMPHNNDAYAQNNDAYADVHAHAHHHFNHSDGIEMNGYVGGEGEEEYYYEGPEADGNYAEYGEESYYGGGGGGGGGRSHSRSHSHPHSYSSGAGEHLHSLGTSPGMAAASGGAWAMPSHLDPSARYHASPALQSLCYELYSTGQCSKGEECRMAHGEWCETCGRFALHPVDAAARAAHESECRARHERLEAVRRSSHVECGICMERVVEKPPPGDRRFGLLACDHSFCLSCIRSWRQQYAGGVDVDAALRTCPVCRVSTHFITPSSVWPASAEEKNAIVEGYKAKLAGIDCRHFNFGQGNCPFGTSCMYRHAYRDGTLESGAPRRVAADEGEVHYVRPVRLSDFIVVQRGRVRGRR